MSYLPLIDLKNGFWPVVHLLYGISEWNFTDMLNIKGYIFLVRTVTLTFPVHELSALDWSEKWFLTCSSFTIWSIWMKLHRYVDHQRLHIVTKDVISLSISVLLLLRHYISHKITFGAPSSGGVLRSACGAFIDNPFPKNLGRNTQVSLICEHYMIPMRKKVNHTLRWWWHLKRSNFDLFKWFEIFILHASLI